MWWKQWPEGHSNYHQLHSYRRYSPHIMMNITNLANQAWLERIYNANAEEVLLAHEESFIKWGITKTGMAICSKTDADTHTQHSITTNISSHSITKVTEALELFLDNDSAWNCSSAVRKMLNIVWCDTTTLSNQFLIHGWNVVLPPSRV